MNNLLPYIYPYITTITNFVYSTFRPSLRTTFRQFVVQCWKFLHPHLPPICNAYRTRCRFQCQSNYAANETIKPPGRSFKRAHPFRQPGSLATDPLRQPDAAATNTMRCDEKSIEILFYVIGLRNRQRQRHNKMSASPPSSILTMVILLEEGGYCTVVGVISVPVFKWQAWRAGSIMNFIRLGPVTGNAFCYYCAGSIYEIFSIAVMPMLPPCPLSPFLSACFPFPSAQQPPKSPAKF